MALPDPRLNLSLLFSRRILYHWAAYVHVSLVGFRDEVDRVSPFKTAQMAGGDAGGHLTAFSA